LILYYIEFCLFWLYVSCFGWKAGFEYLVST